MAANLKNKYKIPWMIASASFLALLILHPSTPYWSQTEPETEYYINYANFEDYSRILKILYQTNDRLAVLTNESLIYWNTGMKPATKQIVYYPWEQSVPDLAKDYQQMLTSNQPEFVFGGRESKMLEKRFLNIFKNGNPSELFVRLDRAIIITDNQKME